MYRCIIFDVDGTMIDTEKAVYATYQRMVKEQFGKYYSPDEIITAYGAPTQMALQRLGFSDIPAACEKYHAYLMAAFHEVQPFEGIERVLDALKEKGITIGLVTSRNRKEVEEDVCLQALMQHFQYIVCADDTQKHKPNPEPILKLLELAHANAAEALYIGDTPYDYRCAKDAGVHFALALWGARRTEGIQAQYNLQHPHELLALI